MKLADEIQLESSLVQEQHASPETASSYEGSLTSLLLLAHA